ncbi:MAG: competence/damage-inducible protein A [Alphaproteobacteria bacterium]
MKNGQYHTAAVIVIGNEILSGRTQDINTSFIAEKLTGRGVRLEEVRVIPDVKEKIVTTVNEMREAHDYVFTTGGIGPTHDDITAESIAEAFGVEIDVNNDAFRMLEKHYGLEELTPPRAKMARIPHGATLIPNPVSAAPGFCLDNVYVFAGVPRIMQAMLEHVLDNLEGGDPVLSASISCSLPESEMAEDVGTLQEKYPDIEIGSYPHFRGGILGLSIVLRSPDKDILKQASDELVAIIKDRGEDPLVSMQFD